VPHWRTIRLKGKTMENKVKAFIPNESDKIRANRKENAGLYREYALIDAATNSAPVVLRLYWPASVCYACVWVNRAENYARGAGRAGGGGYCKASAAAGAALHDAGFRFESDIHGRGLESIRGALAAIAEYIGIDQFYIHVAHA